MRPKQIPGRPAGPRAQSSPDEPVVSSRRAAISRLSAVMERGMPGPVLITGEPGSGKSWVADRLVRELRPDRFSLRVSLTSAVQPVEFLGSIAAALGLPAESTLALPRWRISQLLEQESADGRHWVIVVDEPGRASTGLWEEIQLLIDQLGRPGGFAGMIVTAGTELVGLLETRPLEGFATSLVAHVHLMPLDLDESAELLAPYVLFRSGQGMELENLHREARGNPRRLLRVAEFAFWNDAALTSAERDSIEHSTSAGFESGLVAVDRDQDGFADAPRDHDRLESVPDDAELLGPSDDGPASRSLIPVRPPIRIEDGLVEVGWDGELGGIADDEIDGNAVNGPIDADEIEPPDEPAEDHAAAIKAWTDWARDREILAEEAVESLNGHERNQPEFLGRAHGGYGLTDNFDETPIGRSATLRAEVSQDFPPYSHLFARVRQSKPD